MLLYKNKVILNPSVLLALADMLKRLKVMQGYEALMLTGVDEHGQKIEGV